MQLHGPVPVEMYHRYVEFRPFVKRMFTSSGIQGLVLSKLLYHQHEQIYHFDRETEFDYFKDGPSSETSLKFLDLVHYDTGGRIFTYIITLDALMRFTETGKEFGIDMLSKHTMHSEVAVYTAFSGEFFVRRLKRPHGDAPEAGGDTKTHPPHDIGGGPPGNDPPKDPAYYELVIDNDSGTYRPNGDLLPKLKEFLSYNFPGLKIVTLDCQKDAEVQQALKEEQRKKKEEEGDNIIYRQMSRNSSISSSDESDLEGMIARGRAQPGFIQTVTKDVTTRGSQRKDRWKNLVSGRKGPEKQKSKSTLKDAAKTEKEDAGKQDDKVKEAAVEDAQKDGNAAPVNGTNGTNGTNGVTVNGTDKGHTAENGGEQPKSTTVVSS
jgi:hypothetical protein